MHQHRIPSAAFRANSLNRKTHQTGGTLFSEHRLSVPRVSFDQIFKPWIVLICTLSENHSIRLNVHCTRPRHPASTFFPSIPNSFSPFLPRDVRFLGLIKSKIIDGAENSTCETRRRSGLINCTLVASRIRAKASGVGIMNEHRPKNEYL